MKLHQKITDIIHRMEEEQLELMHKHSINQEPRDSPHTQELYCQIEGLTYAMEFMKTESIQRVFMTEQQKRVYDNLSEVPFTTLQIARFCEFNTKITSAVLRDIYETTSLIGKDTSKPRRLKWFKIKTEQS